MVEDRDHTKEEEDNGVEQNQLKGEISQHMSKLCLNQLWLLPVINLKTLKTKLGVYGCYLK